MHLKSILFTGLFFLIVGIVIYVLPHSSTSTPTPTDITTQKPVVTTTIFPLYDIARNLTGDDIDVELLLPPGASPHTFEPSPALFRQLADADMTFAIGHGVDDWAVRYLADNRSPIALTIVDAHINLRSSEENEATSEHFGEEEHEESPTDPHYWLHGQNGKIIAQNIADTLQMLYPEFADNIDMRLSAYLDALQQTDETVQTILNEVGNKNIVTLHDAWYYFAQAYGLNIVATYTPSAGKEVLPQDLALLASLIDTYNIRTFYTERQLSISSLQAFLDDHALLTGELDAIGGLTDTPSYIDLLLYNANVFASQP